MSHQLENDDADAVLGSAMRRMHRIASAVPPAAVASLIGVVCDASGASAGRLFMVDYGLRSMRELGPDGPLGDPVAIEGTVRGRVFASGETIASGTNPTVLHVPLTDGDERIGLLELDFEEVDGIPAVMEEVVALLVFVLLAKTRYSDAWLRCRRAEALSAAAEVQWDLLPPLAASSENVAVAGILEPAYSIGGDSFDYALNPGHLEFGIVDAMGHGMSAVLMGAAAINGFRNVRRRGEPLWVSYQQVDQLLIDHFGQSRYVTGQIGSLDTRTGVLRWINAGHPLPYLVRNGTFAGQLKCKPSMPMGLGGAVAEVAKEALQSGDRVLFYTDGITDSKSRAGEDFGESRLADYLVRATLERVPVSETVRRLSANVLDFADGRLADDATMFLVEYRVGA